MDSNLYTKPYGFGVELLCTFRLRQTKNTNHKGWCFSLCKVSIFDTVGKRTLKLRIYSLNCFAILRVFIT